MTTPTISKALPFDAAPGGAFPQIMPSPYRVIYDTTVSPTAPAIGIGNLYPSWATVVAVANQFQGPCDIYIRNGSNIPAGNYNMPTSWTLTVDSHGTTVPNGTYFSNSPLKLSTDTFSTITFQESGNYTFTLSNPAMVIENAVLALGTNAFLINGANLGALFLREVVISSGGQGLMSGGAATNIVTAIDQVVIPSNLLSATMTIKYDSTSNVNNQHGNTGIALAAGLVGPAGPAGATGPAGAQGPAGASGVAYLPATAPANNNTYVLNVNSAGIETWQPQGGYTITSFGLSGTNYAGVVEVGTSVAGSGLTWTANFNFTPTSITVTCTGQATQNPSPTGTSSTGMFTGPFTNTTNGSSITVTISVIDPSGAPHSSSSSIVWATAVIWGSVTPPEVVGQALWNTLYASHHSIVAAGNVASLSFASGPGQDQCFARLSTFPTPSLKDSSGDIYPATLLGSSAITENGTSQTYNFYTVGVQGVTFTWSLT